MRPWRSCRPCRADGPRAGDDWQDGHEPPVLDTDDATHGEGAVLGRPVEARRPRGHVKPIAAAMARRAEW